MNADDFADGNAAVEYFYQHISETPLDDLTETAIRDELSMVEAVLEWQKPRHDSTITARRAALETALKHDHFDAHEHNRKGSRYLDQQGNLVVLDGVHWVNDAVITHYHYIIINRQTGEVDRPMEARETLPGDGETHWIAVEELDEHLTNGKLRPADVLPRDQTLIGLLNSGLSPAEAIDYWGTMILGHTQEEWSDKRGVSQGSVGENASKAHSALEE